jgi:regulator of nucleoside diphosphate kinase
VTECTSQGLDAHARASGLIITKFDLYRLRGLIEVHRRLGTEDRSVEMLEIELDAASIVEPTDVPPDVVTMSSTVELVDLETRAARELTVVFPGHADVHAGKVSVLAPLGIVLLGARAGDDLSWPTPGRSRRGRIARVIYQPEAAGHLDL